MRLASLFAAFAVCGCGAAASTAGPVQSTPSPPARIAAGRPAHIAVLVMENEEYGDIIGSCTARSASNGADDGAAHESCSTPYINGLAKRYALAMNMYAISHPSLPNYLALTGGSTFGISSDCTDCTVGARSIVDQLQHARISWKAYMENYPGHCFTGAFAGEYAKKHDPFVYYSHDHRWCASIVPLAQLKSDEQARRLPTFIWITPNLCHDMHDCSPATGDRFLSKLVPRLLRSLGRSGLLFLTWDEGTSDSSCCKLASGGHIATIVAGPGAAPGARLATPVDHYSVLQTIEDLLGLPRLRGAACPCTPSLAPLLRQ
jgi:hypothetical protein